jgi:hypothetical protein
MSRDPAPPPGPDAQAMFRIHLIGPADALEIFAWARAGHRYSAQVFQAAQETLTRTDALARTPAALLCLCCPQQIHTTTGAMVCLLVPESESTDKVIASMLCPACAGAADRRQRLDQAFEEIWPGSRQVDIAPVVGHA